MIRRTSTFIVALAGAMAVSAPLGAQPSLEYNVKAAFLLNFARFIEWPPSAFPDSRAPIQVCVFGTSPFGDALEKTVQGETASGRPIAAREVANTAEAADCHLVFIPESVEQRAGALLHQTGSHAVTVGESRRFLEHGGAVNLVVEDGRVRFNVNLGPVEQRGVRISARMLQLASRVDRAR